MMALPTRRCTIQVANSYLVWLPLYKPWTISQKGLRKRLNSRWQRRHLAKKSLEDFEAEASQRGRDKEQCLSTKSRPAPKPEATASIRQTEARNSKKEQGSSSTEHTTQLVWQLLGVAAAEEIPLDAAAVQGKMAGLQKLRRSSPCHHPG